jgi:hypothetical protein
MTTLKYSDDEVKDFHPIVELCLNKALSTLQKSNIAEIVHHPKIPNTTTIPDFGIRLKASKRFIFIVEVKRSKRDVDSQRYGNQTRSYVQDFGQFWETGYHKYFCITNIEKTLLFADKTSQPLSNCLLQNNPYTNVDFDPITNDADKAIVALEKAFCQILAMVFTNQEPEWDNQWMALTDSFYNNYKSLQGYLTHYDEDLSREVSLYELFRIWCYRYLNDYYALIKDNSKTSYFRLLPTQNADIQEVKKLLSNNFARIMQLDFKQIFSNHPNSHERLFPERLDTTIVENFKSLIVQTNLYMKQAINANSSPIYVFSLLTSKIYQKAELHKKGKVMSDAELSNLLSVLTIENQDSSVIDPCCGDGALLDAAYDYLELLTRLSGQTKHHNDILKQVKGIEIDPFLSQLATFRLLSKKLPEVNNQTEAKIVIGDLFQYQKDEQYDVVLMNPPFLRNDNPDAPITDEYKNNMIQAIERTSVADFVSLAKQPNLYFYFINYVWHLLKDDGRAGIILMTKFMNNSDGVHLKAFLKDKIEAVISYPNSYFSGFRVTTVVVLLRKSATITKNIAFLSVKKATLLDNPSEIKALLENPIEQFRSDYTLKLVDRNALSSSENWKLYLQDPEKKFETFNNLPFFKRIDFYFETVQRGASDNSGGSDVVYPKDFSKKPFSNLEVDFIGYGIKNSKTRRQYVLTENCLEREKAIHFPMSFDRDMPNGLTEDYEVFKGINELYDTQIAHFGFQKWGKIVNTAYNSQVNAQIIMPRAERAKHSVLYNPHQKPIVLSTNFFYLSDVQNLNEEMGEALQLKFITAYLLSSFGQIQYELNANNQEGLRKLERFQVLHFKLPDLGLLKIEELESVVNEFDSLNLLNVEFRGDDGINDPRHNLNLAIGNIIFAQNSLGFPNVDDFVTYFELFLADLVEDRKL